MRNGLIVIFLFSPSATFAHLGHMGEWAGHDHWVAGAALGIAMGLGLWAGLKGKRDDDKKEQDPETESPEAQS